MSEWIDPRYAELVAAWKRARQPDSPEPQAAASVHRPVQELNSAQPWRRTAGAAGGAFG
ncbi:hypothetical protein [Streptomyces sp. NPDC101165]|uniref:hypothetical protein n=1 Tax=Streptomyces sp. NPDC101165 TaxID=3366119 RepID=UPI00382A9ED0